MALNSENRVTTQNTLFSVRNRIFAFFLLAVLIPVGVTLFVSVTTTRTELIEEIDKDLSAITAAQANSLSETLQNQINLLTLLADDAAILAAVETRNASYPNDPAEINTILQDNENLWTAVSLGEASEEFSFRLIYEGSVSTTTLADFQANLSGYSELIITDRYGGVVASSNRTEDYIQSDEEWWLRSFDSSLGAVYISDTIEFDSNTQTNGVRIAIPIVDNNDVVIGVLRAHYELDAFIATLNNLNLGETGGDLLVSRTGAIIATSDTVPQDFPVVVTEAGFQSDSGDGAFDITVQYAGEVYIVESAPITTNGRVPSIDNLDWQTLVIQAESEVLSPISTARNAVLLAGGIIVLFGVAAGSFLAISTTRPLTLLSEAAERIGRDRDWNTQVPVNSDDEFGRLGTAFNTMARELRNVFSDLEQRISARTADLATSAEIAAAANQIREQDELISLTVNLIRDRFDFYYVQAYLVDDAVENAVLSDGTGYAGRRLLAREHSLPLNGKSLVANTINTGQPTVVQDTATSEAWLPNDLLPDTRSEIVIPLRTKDQIIGALDIQHNEANTFDETAQQLFQTLADQLAVTFENVSLLEDTEERAKRLATVSEVAIEASTERDISKMLRTASQLTRENFGLYHAHVYLVNESNNQMELVAGAGEAGLEMVANAHKISLENDQSIVVQAVRTSEPIIVNDITASPNFLPNPLLPDTRSELAVPMIVAGRVVGVLDVQDARVSRFDDDDAQVLRILAAQLGVAVDNVQTLQRSEKQAQELDRIFNSTLDMLGSATFEGYFVQLNDAWEQTLGWTKAELSAEPFVHFVHPDDLDSTLAAASELSEGALVIEFTNRYRKKDGTYIWVQWKSVPDVEAGLINFVARDVTIQRRNEAEVQRRATKMQAVTEISSEIGGILDIEQLLWDVANFTKEKLNHYHAQIYTLSGDGTRLNLVAGAGEHGRKMVERGHSIPVDTDSLVARAARTLDIVVVNDVISVADHLPNPNLPKTRAELSVPFVYSGQLLGVLDVQDDHTDAYTEVEIQVKRTLANQVAVAIQNAKQFQLTQLREKDVSLRATKMQAVTEISSEIGGMLDIDQLLWDVSNLVSEKMDHYHTQIYLLSDDGRRLELRAGSGDTGRNMVASGHSIPLDADSLVARAARERTVVSINDVFEVPDHLPNPNLPLTQAEMAIPLLYGGELLGVLDIQDKNVNLYTEVELQVNRTLSNQISVALQNARQFELTQVRLQEVLATNAIADFVRESEDVEDMLENVMTVTYNSLGADSGVFSYYYSDVDEWHGLVGVGVEMDSDIAKTFIDPGERYPHGMEALNTQEIVAIEDVTQYEGFPEDFIDALGIRSVMVIPIIASGQSVGVIFLNYVTEQYHFNEDDLRLARAISNQISIGIQRQQSQAQILQQTQIAQRRAAELETVANVSAASTTILDVNELLQSVVDLTKQNFNLYHAHIYLYNEEEHALILAAGAGEVGQLMKEHGHRLSADNLSGLVARAARSREAVVVNDTMSVVDFLPNPMLPETRSEMAIPLMVGEEVIGVLDLQSEQVDRFDEEDIRIQGTLASQIAVAVRNAQAFERERKTVERLREVDRLKQEFLANMSHELRTPLNSIIGYSEVLLDGVDGDLTEDAVEDVEAIHTSGKHLLSIINEILDLAKIDAGQMRLSRQEKDLVEILHHIVVSSQVLVKDKPVEILLEEATPIDVAYVDPVRMNQIMLNIVGNAIKFTEEGSVTVRYGMQDDDTILVEIVDTGMGMSEEQLALIFQRFRQVDGSSTRRAGGTGLGLTITRQLVEMHGGDIGVTSEVGTGSVFYFTLPTLELAKRMEEEEDSQREAEAERLQSEPVAGD